MARVKKASMPRRLVLTGDLNLLQIGEVRERLRRELAGGETLEIGFSDVGAVDLSLVQLLCAAHRSALQQGKQLRLSPELPAAFTRLIEEGGLQGHVGCSLDGRIACIWELHPTETAI